VEAVEWNGSGGGRKMRKEWSGIANGRISPEAQQQRLKRSPRGCCWWTREETEQSSSRADIRRRRKSAVAFRAADANIDR
jgi:hypothetical protein